MQIMEAMIKDMPPIEVATMNALLTMEVKINAGVLSTLLGACSVLLNFMPSDSIQAKMLGELIVNSEEILEKALDEG